MEAFVHGVSTRKVDDCGLVAALGIDASVSKSEVSPVSYTHLTLPTNREV